MRWANIGNTDPAWHYLGAITNDKPSAMFKVGNVSFHFMNNYIVDI